jgi:ribosomal protein L37AE/L43A
MQGDHITNVEKLTTGLSRVIFNRMKTAIKAKEAPTILTCPVCMSDRFETISVRMAKCESCGFIWNHEVSDRDNLLLILEHQAKRERAATVPAPLQVLPGKKRKARK